MSTITKEWLQQKIADMEATRDDIPFGLEEDDSNTLAALRIALASLEAEPVCVIDQSNLDYLKSGSDADVWPASRTEMGDVLLYRTAPPAPVSVPDMATPQSMRAMFCHLDDSECVIAADVWNACRAAMLQGADGKPELTVWYGAMPETNGKTNWTAMLHRKGHHPWEGITIDRSEYPGRVRYEADRMRHLIGELADKPDILAYDSDAHSGYVEPVTTAYKLPMQPLVIDAHGTLRFKENPIVRALLDYATEHGYGLNEIALEEFDAEDQMQLAQLIGYSLSGYGTLSYVTDESYERAAAAAPQQEVK